jgi:hypothetical protein
VVRHALACLGDRELPCDADVIVISLSNDGIDMLLQLIDGGDTLV